MSRTPRPALDRALAPSVLKLGSYAHSVVYTVLLVAAITGQRDVVSVFGWLHGVGWIVMSLACLAAVRRHTIPLWLGVMVAVVGGVGPFAGSLGFWWQGRANRALG